MKTHVLLTVWCNISDEAAGELRQWSLYLGERVEGTTISMARSFRSPKYLCSKLRKALVSKIVSKTPPSPPPPPPPKGLAPSCDVTLGKEQAFWPIGTSNYPRHPARTWLSSPRLNNMKKNRNAQNGVPGISLIPWGYATNASPGPEMRSEVRILVKCLGLGPLSAVYTSKFSAWQLFLENFLIQLCMPAY